MADRAPRFRTRTTSITGLVLIAAMLGMTGCYKPLFRERDFRHQFQAYELTRNEFVPTEVPDVFGNPQPALRARLAPK
ncbi:MAG: hypothetical protein AAF432_02730 [Planctomycetota bacterium]